MNNDDIPFVVKVTQKTTIIVLAISLFLMVMLFVTSSVIAGFLFIKKEKVPEPIIFEVDTTAHKIVRVEKGSLNADKESLLRQVTLRNYVLNRETINHIDEKDRWEKVRLISSKSVYLKFYNLMNPDVNKSSPFANNDFDRRIKIISDYPLPNSGNAHRIEFYVMDTIKHEVYPEQRFVAVIQYEVGEEFAIEYEDRFNNILGLTVTKYNIYNL